MTTPLTDATRLRCPADVLHRVVEGEAVLVHVGRDDVYSLDAVGTRLWEWIGEDGRLGVVLARALAEFEVSEERARADVLRLVEDLLRHGLLEVEGPAPA